MIATAPEAARKPRGVRTPADDVGQPLYSADAEKAVLGAMMARPDVVIDRAGEKLVRDDFFVPAHQVIFEALCQMHDGRMAIDITTVHQYLADRKLADAVGSPGILADIAAGLASYLSFPTYVNTVKDKAILRGLIDGCHAIAQDVADNPESPLDVVSRAESTLWGVTRKALADRKSRVRLRDLAPRRAAEILAMDGQREILGIPTGIRTLDLTTGGFRPGEMIVVSAPEKTGKSALTLCWAGYAAAKRWSEEAGGFVSPGHSVGVFSLEMRADELMDRIFAQRWHIAATHIRNGRLTLEEKLKMEKAATEAADLPIVIDDEQGLKLSQFRSRARAMKAEDKIECLILDYLQLLSGDGKQETRQEEVASISRGVKALARELCIPIIVLSQLNDDGKLRESRAIGMDADVRLELQKTYGDGAERYSLELKYGRAMPSITVPLDFSAAQLLFSEKPVNSYHSTT